MIAQTMDKKKEIRYIKEELEIKKADTEALEESRVMVKGAIRAASNITIGVKPAEQDMANLVELKDTYPSFFGSSSSSDSDSPEGVSLLTQIMRLKGHLVSEIRINKEDIHGMKWELMRKIQEYNIFKNYKGKGPEYPIQQVGTSETIVESIEASASVGSPTPVVGSASVGSTVARDGSVAPEGAVAPEGPGPSRWWGKRTESPTPGDFIDNLPKDYNPFDDLGDD